VTLYREQFWRYHVEDPKDPMNDFVCALNDNMGNYAILSHSLALGIIEEKTNGIEDEMWTMYFDGVQSQLGNGVGVVFISPQGNTLSFYYRLEYKVTNNFIEYEALLLWIELANNMGLKLLKVFGDFELIILQVKEIYSTKDERLRAYREVVIG
jgi:hypothetical protein